MTLLEARIVVILRMFTLEDGMGNGSVMLCWMLITQVCSASENPLDYLFKIGVVFRMNIFLH